MADYYLKAGDRLPAITGQLLDGAGLPVDLTGAAVWWTMRRVDSEEPVTNAPAVVQDPATEGRVAFYWTAADTDEPGLYLGEWRAVFDDGRQQTFPNNRQLVVEILPSVADSQGISQADLDWLRSWVGSQPGDEELAARLRRADGARTAVALSILRQRRADLLASPVSYSIRGDITVNATANLTAIDSLITELVAVEETESGAAANGGLVGARLVREGGGWDRGWYQTRLWGDAGI